MPFQILIFEVKIKVDAGPVDMGNECDDLEFAMKQSGYKDENVIVTLLGIDADA